MKGVVLNELDILNNILYNDYIEEKRPLSCLRILGKYYLGQGLNRDETYSKLNEYMSKNYKGYSENNWYGKINGLIKNLENYNNYDVVNVDKIVITEYEWNKIIKLNDKQLERVAFILLVYQKIRKFKNKNNDGWISNTITDIFREASVTLKKEEKGKLLHKLYKKEYISIKNSCDSNGIKINYINTESKDKIIIDNFINVISYYYEYKNNEKWKECSVCRKRFKLKSSNSNQKYCYKCAKKISNLQKNEWKAKNVKFL